MELSPRVLVFEELPSAAEFASGIEPTNVPAVFKRCVKDWKASSNWNPSNGGLDYLQERVGSCVVEAMLSKSAPVFYGDLRSHERVPLPFSAFIGFCKQRMQNADDYHGVSSSESEESIKDCLPCDDAPQQIYLAQVPIMHCEGEDKVQLETLREDICTPKILEEKVLASVNLWMNCAKARSSTHYDPHHNLLCLVAGCKQVILWPPSASPMLYPMPIHGEASNHSSLSLESPDFSVYPRAKCLMDYSQKVILQAGDALFIPEGWFHQVDSDDLTIAVNFWWRSNIMLSMPEHMDAYYLRRILRRIPKFLSVHGYIGLDLGISYRFNLETHSLYKIVKNEVLHKASSTEKQNMTRHTHEVLGNGEADSSTSALDWSCEEKDVKRKVPEQKTMLHQLEPLAIQALHALVSLVHDRISIADSGEVMQSTLRTDSVAGIEVAQRKTVTTNSFSLEDDPLAKILSTLEPCSLQNVFLAMAQNFPRTLEALILHLLSPVAAEVLTRKFDELDRLITENDRNKFYQVFYGAFDDQFDAMDAILNGKEAFALQAFKNVLDKYLGVNSVGSIPGIR